MACVCNPIFINTFVVFVRLYWFEKRFQNVVREARNLRLTGSRSRTRSEGKTDRDIGTEERGVRGREIRVLRDVDGQVQGEEIEDAISDFKDTKEKATKDEDTNGETSSHTKREIVESPQETSPGSPDPIESEVASPFHRDIVFADEVKPHHSRRLSNLERIPEQLPQEQHIAFVENQRNPKDQATLRIPGPRDFDRGDVPQRVEDEDEEGPLNKQVTKDYEYGRKKPKTSDTDVPVELNSDDHPLKRNIIDDPDHSRRPTTGLSAFSFGRRSKATDQEKESMHLRQRPRSRTLGSIISSLTEERDPMPYLSWTPTIGRNSAFIDLTEEQREELGGIEYRALKTLALILVCRSMRSPPFLTLLLTTIIRLFCWASTSRDVVLTSVDRQRAAICRNAKFSRS